MSEATYRAGEYRELLARSAAGGRQIEVAAGTAIHEPEAPAQNLYFIHSGQVRVYQAGPEDSTRLLEILGAGDWFGVAALARSNEYGTRAIAVSAAVVSQIPAERWLALLADQPQATAAFIGQLAGKLQAAHRDAACLVFDDCNQRLIKTLLHFSQSAAATPREDGVVLRITHQQLAQAVGAARETVSLALTNLRHQNVLRTGRNQLFFNPETLQKFSLRVRFSEEHVV